MPTKQWALPVLLLMAVVLRWGSFLPSVLDHDESTYLLIGKALLAGEVYWVDVFDTKPLGIFLLYAAFNALSGGSIFGIRLLAALVVGLSAFLLYRLGEKATGKAQVGWAAGIGYLLMTGIFKFYGLSPNTELFFVPFTLLALLLVWGSGRRVWHFALAGLLLGMGFVIKYVIAADALVIGLFLLWQGWEKGRLVRAIFAECLPMTLAFFVPFAAVAAYYAGIGHWEAFAYYSFEVTGRYPVDKDYLKLGLFVLDFFGRYFPFTLLAIFALRDAPLNNRVWQRFLLLWLGVVLVMTLAPGKTFGHYQIQLMPPLALLAALWFHPERQVSWWSRIRPRTVFVGVCSLFLVLSVALLAYFGGRADKPEQVAAALQERLQPGERFYTGDYQQIIYHLLGQKSVLPYVHPSLIFDVHNAAAMQVDLEAQARLVTDDPNVRYVLLRFSYRTNALTDSIHQYFEVRDTLPDKVLLLERKE